MPSQRQEIILCPSSSVLMIVKLAILLGKVSAVFGTNDKWLEELGKYLGVKYEAK